MTTWSQALAPEAPIIVAALGGLLVAIAGWAAALFTRWTGYQLTAQQRAALHSAAETAAGKIWAAADTAISQQQIRVGDPRLQRGLDWVLTVGAPEAVKSLSITPDQVESLIVAKLGQMQASSPPASPAT